MSEPSMSSVKVEFNEFGFVKNLCCPSCGGSVKESHTDDVGTRFFKCERCGQVSARLKNVKREKWLEHMKPYAEAVDLHSDPQALQKFMAELSQSVKRDQVVKSMVFLCGLSAYTKDPINLFLRGQSSTGKTYNTTQTLKYFPSEDVWMLGALSPTALVHSYGVTVDEKGEEIDFSLKPDKKASAEEKKEWQERLQTARTIVDLQGKILVFLEAPHLETYNMLRPILSHDSKSISYKFTDKTGRGQLRTSHVIIQGAPATVFCTTDEKFVQDLSTRGFTVSPEVAPEKYKEAIGLTGEKKAFPWKFNEEQGLIWRELFSWLRDQLENLNVMIPYARELSRYCPSAYARSMRDFNHLTALVETLALFHCMQRPVLVRHLENSEAEDEKYVLATLKDLDYVLNLWQSVEETTVTGLPEHILHFFHTAVESLSEKTASFSIEDLTREYNEKARERKSSDTIQRWVKHLCDVGWLSKEPDPIDKRRVAVHVIKKPENNRNLTNFLNAVNFKLENFKDWFNEAKQITAQNHLTLKKNLQTEEPSTPEEIFQEYFLCENGLRAVISPSQNQPSQAESVSEVTASQKCGDLRLIPDAEVLETKLRSTFRKGTQEDFEKLAMQEGSLKGNEAGTLFARLRDEGKLAVDPEGWWTWT